MSRFKVGDNVLLLTRVASRYPGLGGVVLSVDPNPLRAMFDEYLIEFSRNARNTVFDFQLVTDVSSWRSVDARVASDDLKSAADDAYLRGTALTRQILLEAADLDIHLEVIESTETISLIGQLLEKNKSRFLPGIEIRLLHDAMPLDAMVTNDLGEFRFSSVPPATLTLEVVVLSNLTRVVGTFSTSNRSQEKVGAA